VADSFRGEDFGFSPDSEIWEEGSLCWFLARGWDVGRARRLEGQPRTPHIVKGDFGLRGRAGKPMNSGNIKDDHESFDRFAEGNGSAGSGLSQDEIETIMRGMRAVFGEAGRPSLARVLVGSRAKTVKEEWSRKRLGLTRFGRRGLF
jgi:hypothetical protein